MICAACGGFYNPKCNQWPTCAPATDAPAPAPLRRVTVRGYGSRPSFAGKFHAFSTDYEELRDGAVPFPCAIVEHDDGRLEAVHVNFVAFESPTP